MKPYIAVIGEVIMNDFIRVLGALKSPYDARDYTLVASETQEYPDTFQLPYVSVKNQGAVASCVAHAVSSIVEYHHELQHGEKKVFSTEFIYGCREKGYIGEGMYPRNAFNVVCKYGDVFESDLAGNNTCDIAMENVRVRFDELKEKAYPHRFSSYFRIFTEDAMKEALMKHGYVLVTMPWHNDAHLVEDVYTYTPGSNGAHAVVLYGWNEKGWLAHNSWGTAFGNEGRFIIPFGFDFIEMWGVTDKIVGDEPAIVTPKTGGLKDLWYKIYNAIVNFFAKFRK